MSNLIYPTLPGLTWSVTKSPIWKTRVQTSVRGRELRIKDQLYPRWKFQQVYSFLSGTTRCTPGYPEVRIMMNFFQSVRGSWDNWLFHDPSDNIIIGQSIGLGNGVETVFQLLRTLAPETAQNYPLASGQFPIGGFDEPIIAPLAYQVYLNNVPQFGVGFNVNELNGVVTFVVPPGLGVHITADIQYYFRCRFTTDTLDFEEFAKNWWELKKIEFESVLL